MLYTLHWSEVGVRCWRARYIHSLWLQFDVAMHESTACVSQQIWDFSFKLKEVVSLETVSVFMTSLHPSFAFDTRKTTKKQKSQITQKSIIQDRHISIFSQSWNMKSERFKHGNLSSTSIFDDNILLLTSTWHREYTKRITQQCRQSPSLKS